MSPESRYPGRTEVAGFFDRALDRVRSLPGVRVAGAATGLPLSVASGDWSFDIEGRPKVNGRRPGAADWYVVTPGYFEALGIAAVRGRLPATSDTPKMRRRLCSSTKRPRARCFPMTMRWGSG